MRAAAKPGSRRGCHASGEGVDSRRRAILLAITRSRGWRHQLGGSRPLVGWGCAGPSTPHCVAVGRSLPYPAVGIGGSMDTRPAAHRARLRAGATLLRVVGRLTSCTLPDHSRAFWARGGRREVVGGVGPSLALSIGARTPPPVCITGARARGRRDAVARVRASCWLCARMCGVSGSTWAYPGSACTGARCLAGTGGVLSGAVGSVAVNGRGAVGCGSMSRKRCACSLGVPIAAVSPAAAAAAPGALSVEVAGLRAVLSAAG